ncbi:hypothetical protein ACTXG5_08325 [Mycobacterium sp. Dal123C01]|uniref:hypothetical protein n=1 Tax=Mycobacterium sp. Dal123C01 TaxID=3457577 RepID=UPI00403E64B6
MADGKHNRFARFLQRLWLPIVVFVTTCVASFFLAFGLATRWGAQQWGSYGQCLAAGLTLAAVVAALRESFRGQRARAVDHEVARRRECLSAVGDVWTGLAQMSLYFTFFTDYLQNLPHQFNPNMPRQDNVPPDRPGDALAYEIGVRIQDFANKWTELVEPPIFVALALLKDTPFDEAMKDINTRIRDLLEKELAKVLNVGIMGRGPDVTTLNGKWSDITGKREEHLNLTRKHFSLDLDVVEAELRGVVVHPPVSPTPNRA